MTNPIIIAKALRKSKLWNRDFILFLFRSQELKIPDYRGEVSIADLYFKSVLWYCRRLSDLIIVKKVAVDIAKVFKV